MSTHVKIAHISDLHFSHVTYSPTQFLSKRWVGNANLFFHRKSLYIPKKLQELSKELKKQKVSHLVITGDLTTTTLDKELSQAEEFIDTFIQEGIPVFVVPGNHDHYTKADYKNKTFYKYFPSHFSKNLEVETLFSLEQDGITAAKIAEGLWIVGLDTAFATSLFLAQGLFSPEIEKKLSLLLEKIPSKDKVILINHFPLFPNDKPRNALLRAENLQALTKKHSNILFYLHGHTHRNCVADLRPNGYPIVLDSGSISNEKTGSWNLLEIGPHNGKVEVYHKNFCCSSPWKLTKEASFTW